MAGILSSLDRSLAHRARANAAAAVRADARHASQRREASEALTARRDTREGVRRQAR